MTQYSIRRSGPLSVHRMPSVTCLRLSDVSVICRVTYFQFPIQSAFLPYIGRQAAPALWRTIGFDTQYETSDVAEISVGTFLVQKHTAHGKDFEFILTVKMETRHPVEGQFGSEFPAICNHCGVMTASNRKTWNFLKQFFGIKTPYGKIFKILFQKFSPPHQSTLLG